MLCVVRSFFISLSSCFFHVMVGVGTPSATHSNRTVWPIQDRVSEALALVMAAWSVDQSIYCNNKLRKVEVNLIIKIKSFKIKFTQ